MLKVFSSVKLTLALLLLLSFIAIGGTISPVEAQRFELFYQSPWFRTLLGLLALNLICCTCKSFPQKKNFQQRLLDGLRTRQDGGEVLASNSLPELAGRLSASGYRVHSETDLLLAGRGAIGRWGSTLVHISILLIMLGGLLSATGFVGTINTYLQQPNYQYFDWDAQGYRDLGFALRADRFQLLYYPIQLRFELVDAASEKSHGELMLFDNESFLVPDSSLQVQLRGFDPEARILTMDVLERGELLGQYQVGEKFEKFGDEQYPAFRLNQIQYRDPVLKQYESEVSILESGQVVKQGTISVNHPLSYRGVSIYQTAYGQDEQGNRSVGYQLSRDPGEWLVWTATLLLMLGFMLAWFVPRRVLGVKEIGGQLQLFPLQGWQGGAGRARLEQLLERLSDDP